MERLAVNTPSTERHDIVDFPRITFIRFNDQSCRSWTHIGRDRIDEGGGKSPGHSIADPSGTSSDSSPYGRDHWAANQADERPDCGANFNAMKRIGVLLQECLLHRFGSR